MPEGKLCREKRSRKEKGQKWNKYSESFFLHVVREKEFRSSPPSAKVVFRGGKRTFSDLVRISSHLSLTNGDMSPFISNIFCESTVVSLLALAFGHLIPFLLLLLLQACLEREERESAG